MSSYEYGVRYARHPEEWEPHRVGFTEEQACQWVAEAEELGFAPGAFSVIRRKLGPWEPAAVEEDAHVHD